jgi:ABC-type uncharacterized transport system permease subunit
MSMDKVAELFAKLADQYGPSVIEAAKAAARIDGYSSLAGSVIGLVIAYAFFRLGSFFRTHKCKDSFDDGPCHAFGYALILASLIPFGIALWAWLDPWTWTAITQPEVYIAKRVLKL